MSSSTSGPVPSLEPLWLSLGSDESSTTRTGPYPIFKVKNLDEVDAAVAATRAYLVQTIGV